MQRLSNLLRTGNPQTKDGAIRYAAAEYIEHLENALLTLTGPEFGWKAQTYAKQALKERENDQIRYDLKG